VPWRFLDAGQLSLPSVSSLPASKNQHRSGPEDPSSAPMASAEPNVTTAIVLPLFEMTP
jgi:hypothetical protein